MKRRIFTLMLVLFASVCAFAQDRNNDDEVVKLDQFSRFNAVEGEVIVKFADNSAFQLKYDRHNKLQGTGMSAVDKTFDKFNVVEVKQLCPNDEKKRSFSSSKSYNGGDVVERDLSRLCLVRIEPDANRAQDADYNIQALTQELIETFNEMEEVEFAEPNYIMYALGIETTDLGQQSAVSGQQSAVSSQWFNYEAYEKEPYYEQQWGIKATKLDEFWAAAENNANGETPKKRPVIAILDTGVDITHPDLEANIWTNPNEIANGSDDDKNGFKDDLHGWDFVNKTGDVRDYNSHGTHCAGIAAAVGDNGKGVTGANPNAYIMPITVMQSNGTGAISTIIEGINYAKNNGADIISMSIGTYAYSIALEQALAQAYQNSVIVAAAGNDGLNIDRTSPCAPLRISHKPMYPAAFTFVLGVEATTNNGDIAGFSNYDCDGPSYSGYGEEQLYNYELSAPGVKIMSTIPNGKYKEFNGTSMACPLVAGGVSALLSAKDYPSQEMLWGDLINYSGNHVDFLACYEAGPAPAQLQMVTYQITDDEGDGDGRPDAGEVLYFYPTLRTTWGAADSITYWLEFAEYEDDRTIEFIENDNIEFGHNLSAYAKSKAVNPIKMKIADNVVDGRYICLVLKATCPNAEAVMEYPFEMQVENGVELKGTIMENTTLYPNVHYIVTGNVGVYEDVTLTMLPGVILRFKNGTKLFNSGKIIAKGEPGNMITFTSDDEMNRYSLYLNYGDTLSYCIVENGGSIACNYETSTDYYNKESYIYQYIVDSLMINLNEYFSNTTLKYPLLDNCIYRHNYRTATNVILRISIGSNIFYNEFSSSVGSYFNVTTDGIEMSNRDLFTPFKSNNFVSNIGYVYVGQYDLAFCKDNIFNNSYPNLCNNYNDYYNIKAGANSFKVGHTFHQLYLGSSNDDIINSHICDFDIPNSGSSLDIDITNIGRRPSSEAHGIVWKVLVNGKDAQDEFEEVVPLGVGRHKFEVYFNRAMDTSVAPMVAMGVRPPYTQNAIASDGSWSADSTIYTVYLDLDASSVTDGLNRIYVANAQDNDFFEIPFENLRFNVQVSAAGSMSAGFEATPGIGKVDLVWENDSTYFNDHLGWNMYRYQRDENGISSDTILINKEMITDTVYTDFDVVPGERYYYYYKTLRTNLTESDASNNVSTVPLTAQPGDANGSLKVDVIDIVTVVSYITGDNPQPFIFGAADVNADGEIDVMDIVRIVNIIVSGKSGAETASEATAKYFVEDGILYVDTPVELGGVQVYLNSSSDNIETLAAMDKFEQVGQFVEDGRYLFMAYSLSGEKLAPGKHAILRIGVADVEEMILADARGNEVIAVEETMSIGTNEMFILSEAYPNPFNGMLNIPYVIGADNANVMLTINNIMGQQVANIDLGTQSRGEYKYEWQPKSDMPSGIYIINMYVNGNMMQRNKVVYMK